MHKNFELESYVVDECLADTLTWFCHHQECFDRFEYDAISQQLKVYHANGADIIRQGMYLNAQYGILITSL